MEDYRSSLANWDGSLHPPTSQRDKKTGFVQEGVESLMSASLSSADAWTSFPTANLWADAVLLPQAKNVTQQSSDEEDQRNVYEILGQFWSDDRQQVRAFGAKVLKLLLLQCAPALTEG